MKTIKLFMMAALALMTAACSSDDNDLTTPTPQPVKPEGIPFSATIESESATTRALSESGNTITAEWADNEEVALIYTDKNNTKQLAVATVKAHDDGSATITATLTAIPDDDADVEIVYPASTVDETTRKVKDLPTLLSGQSGELSNISTNYDLRKATGKLKIENETASLKERVKLINQLAILRIQAKKPYNSDATLEFISLTVTIDGTQYFNIQKQSGAQNNFYVALPPVSNGKVSFLAKDENGNTYGYSKSGVTFEAGKYYQSTLKMMGAFSVSADKRVCFSQGNLQYKGNTWSFATSQWDNLSYGCGGSAPSGTMDLFTWGNIDSPDCNGTTYSNSSENLSGNSDWGYNAISNGGNKNSQWRTLTISEWEYLFKTRTNATSKYGFATVNDRHGIIIVPDGFSDPNKNDGSKAFAGSSTTGWNANIYTKDNWTYMEKAGCVFLPAGGQRNGSTVSGYQIKDSDNNPGTGYYWSASCGGSTIYAQYLEFNSGNLQINSGIPSSTTNKNLGYSVRLVRDL